CSYRYWAGPGAALHRLSSSNARRGFDSRRADGYPFLCRRSRGVLLSRTATEHAGSPPRSLAGTDCRRGDLRPVPLQQAIALQLALRLACFHRRDFLWPRLALPPPHRRLWNYSHAGGCGVGIVVQSCSPWPLALPPQARAKAARVGDPGSWPLAQLKQTRKNKRQAQFKKTKQNERQNHDPTDEYSCGGLH